MKKKSESKNIALSEQYAPPTNVNLIKTMKKETAPKNLFNALKDNPEKIIKWAENEIKLYKELIELVKEKSKRK